MLKGLISIPSTELRQPEREQATSRDLGGGLTAEDRSPEAETSNSFKNHSNLRLSQPHRLEDMVEGCVCVCVCACVRVRSVDEKWNVDLEQTTYLFKIHFLYENEVVDPHEL